MRSDLKLSTANTWLGYLWWIVDPLFMMMVYYFVVHLLFERGGDNYHVFLLSALVAWQWFAKSISTCTAAFPRASVLISEVKFPLFTLLLVPTLVNGIYALFGFFVVLLFVGELPSIALLYLIPLMLVQVILILGLACFLSVLNVYARDVQRMIGFVLRAWWFMSPVLYGIELVLENDKIPQLVKDLFLLNPFSTLFPAYREILLNGQIPDMINVGLWGGGSLIVLQAGTLLLRKNENRIAKTI